MFRKIQLKSFLFKLLLTYMFLLICSVSVLGVYSFQNSIQSIEQRTQLDLHRSLQLIKEDVYYRMKEIEGVSDIIYFDQDFQYYMRVPDEGWSNYEITTQYIIPSLKLALNSTSNDIRISMYLNNETFPEMYYSNESDPLEIGKTFQTFHINRLTESSWFPSINPKIEAVTEHKIWAQVDNDEQYQNVSFIRSLYDFQEMKNYGFIRITVKLKDIMQMVDSANLGSSSELSLLNESNLMLFPIQPDKEKKAYEGWDDPSYLMAKEVFPDTNWSLVARIPKKVLTQDAIKVRNVTIIVCSVSFIILTLLSWAAALFFSRRIQKIIGVLKFFRDGDFQRRIRMSGKDEFSQIMDSLNELGEHTDYLIKKVYMTGLEKKDAELRSLQAQINPHFLYNTLSSINSLAKLGEIKKLQAMVLGLSKFYRLTLNDGKFIIPVMMEIDQVKEYINIQRIKHEDRFTIDYRIEDEVLQYSTIKLILQPFVENILEHAWHGSTTNLHIALSVYGDDDAIVFQIRDNGIGIDEITLEQIFHPNGVKVGYGIVNVDERIKLQFGASYGVTISSVVGEGTEIKIKVPKYIPA